MNNVKVLESLNKYISFSVKRNGFDRIFDKVNIISAGNGQCIAELIVDKQHTNGYGTLHGGFTASAIDLFSGLALLTHPSIVKDIDALNSGVSVNINVSYLAAAKIGDEVVINAETLKLGRTLAYLKVSLIKKENNVILAHGTHTKFIAH
ncbi:HotDog domain,Thioesterase domain,Phenylacetic acid degradation-related domain [Cinara cedri]|uniref:Acyl-coenzyme A thioesterase 13 n=1 Tax=Cinara cedri TaxID=506608 RepID=A0A5E4N9F3_9HEMI|nr:HotDog domain,Thioesterase domain,Phenylacetic acid degradation-related domain [Cinara cedri]